MQDAVSKEAQLKSELKNSGIDISKLTDVRKRRFLILYSHECKNLCIPQYGKLFKTSSLVMSVFMKNVSSVLSFVKCSSELDVLFVKLFKCYSEDLTPKTEKN